MEENITVEIKSDIFVKENDNVIWTSYRVMKYLHLMTLSIADMLHMILIMMII